MSLHLLVALAAQADFLNTFIVCLMVSQPQRQRSSFSRRSPGQQLYLRFANINVVLSGKHGAKALVDNITAHAVSGRVLAIMGPSGAGKTTLLNGLSGRAVYAKVGAHCDLLTSFVYGSCKM